MAVKNIQTKCMLKNDHGVNFPFIAILADISKSWYKLTIFCHLLFKYDMGGFNPCLNELFAWLFGLETKLCICINVCLLGDVTHSCWIRNYSKIRV